jgi:hypothetical protein
MGSEEAEMKMLDRQHHDVREWVGEPHSVRAVAAASALEAAASDATRASRAFEGVWRQHTPAIDSDVLILLQELSRGARIKFDKGILDAIAAAVTVHADSVAAQLEITPDQLYSMTFADFINKYEGKGSDESDGPTARKSLVERLNEAYDEDAEREDEEFFRTTKGYYRRRFHSED